MDFKALQSLRVEWRKEKGVVIIETSEFKKEFNLKRYDGLGYITQIKFANVLVNVNTRDLSVNFYGCFDAGEFSFEVFTITAEIESIEDGKEGEIYFQKIKLKTARSPYAKLYL